MAKRSVQATPVIGGVDTHKDTHTAAAVDATGKVLGNATFPATSAGYVELLAWLRKFGQLERVGVEGTGSYGSGLAALFRQEGVVVVEVNRPNRQARRRHGKSDAADAEAAARATLAEDATGLPKAQNGPVEAIRILRLERRSAIHARTKSANQLHAVVSTAPEPTRATLRGLSLTALVARASKLRKAAPTDATSATLRVLRALAQRWLQLDREVALLDGELETLVTSVAPALVALRGVGVPGAPGQRSLLRRPVRRVPRGRRAIASKVT